MTIATGPVGAEVLEFTARRMDRQGQALRETWALWSRLRGAGALPSAEDVDLDAAGPLAGHLMTIDHVRPGCTRVRRAGALWEALVAVDPAGLPIRSLFDLSARGEVQSAVERALARPSALEIEAVAEGAAGETGARVLILPLRSASGAANRALACLAPAMPLDGTPRRLLPRAIRALPLERRSANAPSGPAALRVVG